MLICARGIWNGTGQPQPGRLAISNGKIEAILPPPPAQIDLGEAILCAGFVNAHTHLDLSLTRPTPQLEGTFDDWLQSVIETRKNLGDDGIIVTAAAGADEALSGGTTAVFDIDAQGHSTTALSDSALRRVLLREVISLQAQPGVDQEALATFLAGSPDPERELRGVSPHSSYTVHPEVLAPLLPWIREQGIPWAMHIAEPEWERELLVEGTGEGARFLEGFDADPQQFQRGKTMIESLHDSKDLSAHGLVIHGNDCSADELKLIAEAGSALVWCPRSHAFFDRDPHPAPHAAAAGLTVLLGTDGKVSAGTLSMLDEMRAARSAGPDLDAEIIWQMATINARRWLAATGHPELLGSGTLKEGDPADLVAVSMAEGDGPLLERALGGEVIGTWIDGRALQPEMLEDAQ